MKKTNNNPIFHNNCSDNINGIFLNKSSNNNISGNNINRNYNNGIYFLNSRNNTILGNNCFDNNINGIYVNRSDNNMFINNNCSNNHDNGIFIYSSSNNTIMKNNCSNNHDDGISVCYKFKNIILSNNCLDNHDDGIYISSSNYNNISSNNCSNNNDHGIYLISSQNNMVSDNIMVNCGIYVQGYDNQIDTSNQVNGKPVLYYEDKSGVNLIGVKNVGQVILVNCCHSILKDLEISDTSIAIYLLYSKNIIILDNNCSNNIDYGIYVKWSSSNIIYGNNCSNNFNNGIYLHGSYNNTILDNNCPNNGNGICLVCSSNHNNISGNCCPNNGNGICLMWASNKNNISGNNASNNHDNGIWLDCSFSNNISSNNCFNNNDDGIYFRYSKNNNILSNNCSDNNDNGIYFDYWSDDNLISKNYCSNNIDNGIYISSSNYNNISANNCSNNNDNGIWLVGSKLNNISRNLCFSNYYGICLENSSNNNTILNNIMVNCGLFVESYDNQIDTSNQVNGKPILYYEDKCGVNIIGVENVGEVILYNCNNSIIKDIKISGTTIAIQLFHSNNNIISGCNCSKNKYAGISLYNSDNNSILTSKCSENNYGIYLDRYSINNKIWINFLVDNWDSQAYCVSFNNEWDNGTYGNYWGDYINKYPHATNNGVIWDISYKIDGVNRFDEYPLCNTTIEDTVPPKWDPMPQNQIIQFGESINLRVNAIDFEIDEYWINDTYNFSIDEDRVITSSKTLSTGIYFLKIYVNDTSGNENFAIIKITVESHDINSKPNIYAYPTFLLTGIVFFTIIYLIRKFLKNRQIKSNI